MKQHPIVLLVNSSKTPNVRIPSGTDSVFIHGNVKEIKTVGLGSSLISSPFRNYREDIDGMNPYGLGTHIPSVTFFNQLLSGHLWFA